MTCPRCETGCVVQERVAFTCMIDSYCITCGWRRSYELVPIEADHATRWYQVLCVTCHERRVLLGYVQCILCKKKSKMRKVANL